MHVMSFNKFVLILVTRTLAMMWKSGEINMVLRELYCADDYRGDRHSHRACARIVDDVRSISDGV